MHNRDVNFNKLIELGLKEKEVVVYLSLVKLGRAHIAQAARETGLTKQNLYNYLEMLRDKGLVGELPDKNFKYFYAKDVKNFQRKIINSLNEKVKTIDLISKELTEYKISNINNIKYYTGCQRIRSLFIEEMKRQKPGSQEFSIETCSAKSNFIFSSNFMKDKFKLYENIRINRKTKVHPLVVIEDEWDLEREIGDVNNLRQFSETRVIKQPKLSMSFLYIWANKIWLMLTNNREFELLEISNQKVRTNYKFIFDLLWEQSTLVYKSKE